MTEQALATVANTGVAVYDYGSDAGAGFENLKPSDFKPSFLRVLQPLSPQVMNDLPGAKPGRVADSVTNEFYDSVLFVPAVHEHVYVAWKPRTEGGGEGKGFGGVFKPEDPMVVKQLTGHDKFARGDDGKLILPRTPDGEFQLIETRYMHGVQLIGEERMPLPMTAAFTSTGLPVAEAWLKTMRMQIIPGVGKPFPLFAHVSKLGSTKVTKDGNTWFNWSRSWAGDSAATSRLAPDSEQYLAGKQVAEAFKKGTAAVDYAAAGAGTGDGEAGKAAKAAAADKEIPF